jgi:NitT/TauT family transport system permease protein
MAAAWQVTAGTIGGARSRVVVVRIAIIATVIAAWEALAASGWLFRDVVPSLAAIGGALARLLAHPEFYVNLAATVAEIGAALVIGGVAGLATGILFGANRFLSDAFESLLLYLGPTPKIIFFPVMIMWFGVGSGSKIAMGAISCFFPIAINTAAGMREIDRVLISVGRSFRASPWQMVTKIYLPAMRAPIVNGVRLGLGVAVIGTLLAETKLSNRGLGYLVIQAYSLFDMPRMYALLIVLFVLAIGANAIIGRLGGTPSSNLSKAP